MSDYLLGQRLTELEDEIKELKRRLFNVENGIRDQAPKWPVVQPRNPFMPVNSPDICPACKQRTPCVCGSVNCPFRVSITS